MPKYIKDKCKDVLPATFDIAKSKGYYNKMGDLIGSSWVPSSIQIQAFEFISHRLKDFELPLLLKKSKLLESVQFRIAQEMDDRGISDQIPSYLRARKIARERRQSGELLSLNDWKQRKKANIGRSKEPAFSSQIACGSRLRRRKIC